MPDKPEALDQPEMPGTPSIAYFKISDSQDLTLSEGVDADITVDIENTSDRAGEQDITLSIAEGRAPGSLKKRVRGSQWFCM
ncbi:MAG: hypothetical protein ACOCY9_03050, partial [Desulfohalobiaceae bacterium]